MMAQLLKLCFNSEYISDKNTFYIFKNCADNLIILRHKTPVIRLYNISTKEFVYDTEGKISVKNFREIEKKINKKLVQKNKLVWNYKVWKYIGCIFTEKITTHAIKLTINDEKSYQP